MNVLILGSGAREHTMAWKLSQSPENPHIYVAPGNAGTADVATNLPLSVTDFNGIAQAVHQFGIDLVLVGPEDPLVLGISDFFAADLTLAHVPVIGPNKTAAQLEGSKQYAKEFLIRHSIPTAAYAAFTAETLAEGQAFLTTLKAPYVLKADGLAAGKGVLILSDLQEAQSALAEMLVDQKFGAASQTVVIEEFLSGIELSCFVLTDGTSYKVLPTAKDYKRIGEGDTGLNTGGMGAISPVPFADQVFLDKVHERIVVPTIEGLKKDNITYVGFIFIGLIKVGDDPFVIEYNVRMGDPETEVVLPRIKTDLLTLLRATGQGKLHEIALETDTRTATTVMAVAGGYPEAYEKGHPISGIDQVKNALVFQAGTAQNGDQVCTNGGRVLAVTAFGTDYKQALAQSYLGLSQITFQDMYYRKDLGFDLG